MRHGAFSYQYADEIEATETKPRPQLEPPVCQADADWREASLAADAADRSARVDALSAQNRLAIRAACTTDHARALRRAAATLNMTMAVAKRDGFDLRHAPEISELLSRTIRDVQKQQEAAR